MLCCVLGPQSEELCFPTVSDLVGGERVCVCVSECRAGGTGV